MTRPSTPRIFTSLGASASDAANCPRIRKNGRVRSRRICTVEGCGKFREAKGLCAKHYYRIRFNGTLDAPLTAEERFDAAYRVMPSGCWEWQKATNNKGYGLFCAGYAHRYSYERFRGPITGGLFVCHTCDNPPCVNPSHFFLGTQLDNQRDAVRKGRHKNPGAEKTHCAQGHEFTPENTGYTNKGWRICKRCRRVSEAKSRQRRVA